MRLQALTLLFLGISAPAKANGFDLKPELPAAREAIDQVRAEKDESYLEWLWNDQLAPTLKNAGDERSIWTLIGTGAATVVAHQHDSDFRERYGDYNGLTQEQGRWGAVLGSGFPGILVAATQVYYDTDHGLAHARALAFTSLSHITIAASVNRERPNGRRLSFPSGHTSSSFATAGSLAYAYGPKVGVPAYLVASFIGFSRISNNAHWLSDIVFGAGLGVFWARSSALAKVSPESISWTPIYEPSVYGPKVGLGMEKRF